jgi:ABC-type protease/lipase transport system fused ATPase/permease subunit
MSWPALSQPRPSLLSQAFSTCRNGFVAVLVFSLCINVLMLTAPGVVALGQTTITVIRGESP